MLSIVPRAVYLFDQHENIVCGQQIQPRIVIRVLGIPHHGVGLPAPSLSVREHRAT